MSLEIAAANLQELSKDLNLGNLEFDESHTCILGIDDEFSLHVTYEETTDRLYLYSPLLDGLPSDDKSKLRLYEGLLQGAMLGGQMAGGGVGLAIEESLILMHCTIDMQHAEPSELRSFCPLFIETVEKWRKAVVDIVEGRKPDDVDIVIEESASSSASSLGDSSSKGGNSGGAPPQFIRG